MPDLLESEATRWTIGTLVTLALGLGAIFGPVFLSRKRKNVWYWSSVFPVVREEIEKRVEVLFDGRHVPNAYVSVIGLRYRGNEPILEGDYRNPISFDFGDAQVLSAEVIDTKPNGINASVNVKGENRVVFDPIALNDENQIDVRVLITGRNSPTVTGHIVGVKEIRNQRQERNWFATLQYTSMAIIAAGVIASIVGASTDPTPDPPPDPDPRTPLETIGITLVYAGAFMGFFSALAFVGRARMLAFIRRRSRD